MLSFNQDYDMSNMTEGERLASIAATLAAMKEQFSVEFRDIKNELRDARQTYARELEAHKAKHEAELLAVRGKHESEMLAVNARLDRLVADQAKVHNRGIGFVMALTTLGSVAGFIMSQIWNSGVLQ